jgi:hypothetical protein
MMSSDVQMPPAQNCPEAQLASVVQSPLQRPVAQPNVPHEVCCTAGQRPEPLQVAASVATLPAQLPLRQLVSTLG